VASGIYLEGLAVDHKRHIVWYSDVIAGGIHGFTADGTVPPFNADRMWTGGILVNNDGLVLSSGAGGIMWNDPATGESGWLIRKIKDQPINGVNEMIPDGKGGIFFGTIDIETIRHGGQPGPSKIYQLTADREVIEVVDEVGFANGILYDRNHSKFYCNDTFRCTWVFDVQSDLTLTNKRVLIDKDDVDGMALDVDGNVWITGFRSGFLTRVSPTGTILPRIETPAGAITQIRFGGPEMKDVYINAVPIDGGDNLKQGEIPTEYNSFLFRARSAIAGSVIEATRFELR